MRKKTHLEIVSKKTDSLTTQMPGYIRQAIDAYVIETGKSSSGATVVEIILDKARNDPLFKSILDEQKAIALVAIQRYQERYDTLGSLLSFEKWYAKELEAEKASELDKLGEVLQAADKVLALAPKRNAKPKKPEGDKILVQF